MHMALNIDHGDQTTVSAIPETTDTRLGEQLCITRQPILDRLGQVVAYELLYQRAHNRAPRALCDDQEIAQVLLATFQQFGSAKLSQGLPTFIDITEQSLHGQQLHNLDSSEVVLEVPGNLPFKDASLGRRIRQLRKQGYRIVLKDFGLNADKRGGAKNADIVKLDVQALNAEQIAGQVKWLRECSDAKLLADKVETQRQFDTCSELGFDYFQGYYFLQPRAFGQNPAPVCHNRMLQLLGTINDPHTTLATLGDLVRRNVTLSYQVLSYINSPLCGFYGRITSIQHAVLLIGLRRLQQLTSLIVLAGIDDKPAPLLETSLIRAKMCEEVVRRLAPTAQEQAFCVGLLSTLDGFFDQPMERVLDVLRLAPELADALRNGAGTVGHILRRCSAFKQGHWEEFDGSDAEVFQNAYFHASDWADQILTIYRHSR